MQKLIFDEENHIYTLDGVRVPSVTQILQGAGLVSFNAVNPDILERAQKFGSASHLACALDDKNQLDMKSLDPALLPYLENWRQFKKDFGITEFAEIEKQVFSKRYQYAGCLDRLWENTLIEIKTSTSIPTTTGLQLIGYQTAYREMTKIKIKQRLCVQLLEGTYKVQEYKDKIDASVFLACLTLINWKKINNL